MPLVVRSAIEGNGAPKMRVGIGWSSAMSSNPKQKIVKGIYCKHCDVDLKDPIPHNSRTHYLFDPKYWEEGACPELMDCIKNLQLQIEEMHLDRDDLRDE
jgi:hypothetical protein